MATLVHRTRSECCRSDYTSGLGSGSTSQGRLGSQRYWHEADERHDLSRKPASTALASSPPAIAIRNSVRSRTCPSQRRPQSCPGCPRCMSRHMVRREERQPDRENSDGTTGRAFANVRGRAHEAVARAVVDRSQRREPPLLRHRGTGGAWLSAGRTRHLTRGVVCSCRITAK